MAAEQTKRPLTTLANHEMHCFADILQIKCKLFFFYHHLFSYCVVTGSAVYSHDFACRVVWLIFVLNVIIKRPKKINSIKV